MDLFEKQKYVFANIFLIANKLQIIGDNHLKRDGLTVKQWFLILIISQFRGSPKLTEVAKKMGTSRQNVKQLAMKLEQKGFLLIKKDDIDSRVIRLKLTKKNEDFWKDRDEIDQEFILKLFSNLDKDEINYMYESIQKLLNQIENNFN